MDVEKNPETKRRERKRQYYEYLTGSEIKITHSFIDMEIKEFLKSRR